MWQDDGYGKICSMEGGQSWKALESFSSEFIIETG